MKLDFVPGPVFENPIRTMADVEALRIPQMEPDVPYVLDTIKILRRELATKVPLIGFGGAPFTLACYMVEGKGSKDFAADQEDDVRRPRGLRGPDGEDHHHGHGVPERPDQGRRPGDPDLRHLGRHALPGRLRALRPPLHPRLINGLNRTNIPVIHFVKGAGAMLDIVKKAGGDVMGLDWHVNLGKARDILGRHGGPGEPRPDRPLRAARRSSSGR